jgi:hypothetical protein
MKDDTYFFHQTPEELCKKLVSNIPDQEDGDTYFEPFAGEGSFVRAFPENSHVITTEKEDGTDYRDITDFSKIDWVISNPPFRLDEHGDGRRVNSFYQLTDYFAGKTQKGLAFLGNDHCLAVFTPKRLRYLYEEKGVYIYKIVVCNVKKWRGRYFFVIFKNRDKDRKEKIDFFDYIEGSF